MATLEVMFDGGSMKMAAKLAATKVATIGKWCYFSAANSVAVLADADAAAQQAIGIFMETLATLDADTRPERRTTVLLGPCVIKTDQVQAGDVPVVGQLVYVNDSAVLCDTSANNRLVGQCIAGADGEGNYTIQLTL